MMGGRIRVLLVWIGGLSLWLASGSDLWATQPGQGAHRGSAVMEGAGVMPREDGLVWRDHWRQLSDPHALPPFDRLRNDPELRRFLVLTGSVILKKLRGPGLCRLPQINRERRLLRHPNPNGVIEVRHKY